MARLVKDGVIAVVEQIEHYKAYLVDLIQRLVRFPQSTRSSRKIPKSTGNPSCKVGFGTSWTGFIWSPRSRRSFPGGPT